MSNARPMGWKRRLNVYLRRYGETGRWYDYPVEHITPKQRRRLFHKAGKRDRKWEEKFRTRGTT